MLDKNLKYTSRFIARLLVCLVLFSTYGCQSTDKGKFIAIGTSTKSGVYYPVAREICNLLNSGRETHLVRCLATESGGSIYNIPAIATGELDVALTRAGLAHKAFRGEEMFKAYGANSSLRLISILYSQPVSIIVKQESNIQKFNEVKGKRVNLGNLGSGKRGISELLLEVMNWSHSDFSEVYELNTSNMGKAFCSDKVDVLIEAIGMPSKFLDRMVNDCKGRFVDISDDVVELIRQKGPFYTPGIIPKKFYPTQEKDVRTFNVNVVLISSARVNDATIYELTKAIFGDVKKLKKIHQVFSNMMPRSMVDQAPSIPYHDGALRYFKEHGFFLPSKL